MPPMQAWLGCWGLNVGTRTCVWTLPLSFNPAQSCLLPAHTTKICFVLSFCVAWLTKGLLLDEVELGRWFPQPLLALLFYHDGFQIHCCVLPGLQWTGGEGWKPKKKTRWFPGWRRSWSHLNRQLAEFIALARSWLYMSICPVAFRPGN